MSFFYRVQGAFCGSVELAPGDYRTMPPGVINKVVVAANETHAQEKALAKEAAASGYDKIWWLGNPAVEKTPVDQGLWGVGATPLPGIGES